MINDPQRPGQGGDDDKGGPKPGPKPGDDDTKPGQAPGQGQPGQR